MDGAGAGADLEELAAALHEEEGSDSDSSESGSSESGASEGDTSDSDAPDSPASLYHKAVLGCFAAAPKGRFPCATCMEEAYKKGCSVEAAGATTFNASGMAKHNQTVHRKLYHQPRKAHKCSRCKNLFKTLHAKGSTSVASSIVVARRGEGIATPTPRARLVANDLLSNTMLLPAVFVAQAVTSAAFDPQRHCNPSMWTVQRLRNQAYVSLRYTTYYLCANRKFVLFTWNNSVTANLRNGTTGAATLLYPAAANGGSGSSSAELLSSFRDNILKGCSEKLSDEAIEDALEKGGDNAQMYPHPPQANDEGEFDQNHHNWNAYTLCMRPGSHGRLMPLVTADLHDSLDSMNIVVLRNGTTGAAADDAAA